MVVQFHHLLVYFVEHCRVVVFFRVVMEADHAIFLVNASIDLTIFNLEIIIIIIKKMKIQQTKLGVEK